MKRLIITVLLVCIIGLPMAASAAVPAYEGQQEDVISYILVEPTTGQVLAAENAAERVYPGSTTKLMTALLLLEEKGLEGEVTAGEEILNFNPNSTLMGLVTGETLTVKDLLYGLLLPSGNDAAATIAVYVSGSEDAFCERMTERAKELGMKNTNFVNSCGLFRYQDEDNPIPEWKLGMNHYTTAEDMAILAAEITKWPEIMEATSTAEYELAATNKHSEPRVVANYNHLIYTPKEHPDYSKYLYGNATGMKTGLIANISIDGTIYKSYGSLVASAEKDGLSLVALIFGDYSRSTGEDTPNAYQRWQIATGLFDYGFSNYAAVNLADSIQPVEAEAQVAGYAENDAQQGMLSAVSVVEQQPDDIRIVEQPATEDNAVTTEFDFTQPLTAPVEEGQEVGTVSYLFEGQVLYTAPLVAQRNVFAVGEEQKVEEELGQTGQGQQEQAGQTGQQEKKTSRWWLWLVIPGAVFGGLLLVRAYNLNKRRKRRSRRVR